MHNILKEPENANICQVFSLMISVYMHFTVQIQPLDVFIMVVTATIISICLGDTKHQVLLSTLISPNLHLYMSTCLEFSRFYLCD